MKAVRPGHEAPGAFPNREMLARDHDLNPVKTGSTEQAPRAGSRIFWSIGTRHINRQVLFVEVYIYICTRRYVIRGCKGLSKPAYTPITSALLLSVAKPASTPVASKRTGRGGRLRRSARMMETWLAACARGTYQSLAIDLQSP
jgi:hypothetical protein